MSHCEPLTCFRPTCWYRSRRHCSAAQAGRRKRAPAAAAGALTLTNKYSANLDANRRTPGSMGRQSSLQTGRRARFRRYGARGALARARRGLVRARAGRPAHRCAATGVCSRGCGAAAALHVTVRRARSSRLGHRLSVASPSYCLPDDRRRALHRPAALRLPPAAPSPRRARPPRPEEFSASGGKNRLCSEPRIISARRTAPLRPPAAPPHHRPRRRRRRPRRSSALPFTLHHATCQRAIPEILTAIIS